MRNAAFRIASPRNNGRQNDFDESFKRKKKQSKLPKGNSNKSTEVALGEREEVSNEVKMAQMAGYRNELVRASRGLNSAATMVLPRVREPETGWLKEHKLDRELYRKR